MKTHTIRNDFHGTEARVRPDAEGCISESQARRVRRALCGVQGCTCGGHLGERGPQEVGIWPLAEGFRLIPLADLKKAKGER